MSVLKWTSIFISFALFFIGLKTRSNIISGDSSSLHVGAVHVISSFNWWSLGFPRRTKAKFELKIGMGNGGGEGGGGCKGSCHELKTRMCMLQPMALLGSSSRGEFSRIAKVATVRSLFSVCLSLSGPRCWPIVFLSGSCSSLLGGNVSGIPRCGRTKTPNYVLPPRLPGRYEKIGMVGQQASPWPLIGSFWLAGERDSQ